MADDATDDPLNSVLGKVRPILEAFAATDNVLSLAELVRRSGVPKASVHRLAGELSDWGVLERCEGGYRLGLRLFELGQRVHCHRLRVTAQPFLEDLLDATQETVQLVVHDGLEAVSIKSLSVHQGVVRRSELAERMPLHCTAAGKAILAVAAPSLLTEVVNGGLAPLTRHSITSAAVLAQQIARARGVGIATEIEETRLGYASLAVPLVLNGGRSVAAISVTAPTSRMSATRLAAPLRSAAAGISQWLAD